MVCKGRLLMSLQRENDITVFAISIDSNQPAHASWVINIINVWNFMIK